jgi:hypothetical protein
MHARARGVALRLRRGAAQAQRRGAQARAAPCLALVLLCVLRTAAARADTSLPRARPRLVVPLPLGWLLAPHLAVKP